MRCISPVLVRNDGRRDFVPCGKCNHCLEVKRGDWSFRLRQEQKTAHTSYFLTMTYEGGTVPSNSSGELELRKTDVQLFTKRLRKENSKLTSEQLRYYTVGEYGTRFMRPHYHSIMFNLHPNLVKTLPDVWGLGHIHAGTVTDASIHYVTKYVINRHGEFGGREPPFSLMSRRPGIGSVYLDTHTRWHREGKRNHTNVNGMFSRLPRYYKDKMFTPLERKIFAGESISQGDEEYWKEIERLDKFHSDPQAYYEECIVNRHETITSKLNDKNLF